MFQQFLFKYIINQFKSGGVKTNPQNKTLQSKYYCHNSVKQIASETQCFVFYKLNQVKEYIIIFVKVLSGFVYFENVVSKLTRCPFQEQRK